MFFHVCRFLFGLFKSPFLNSLEPCIYLSYFKPYLKPAQKKPLLVVELEELSNICRACCCLCCRLCENDRINYSLGLPGWNYVQIHKIEGKWLSGTEIHCKVLHLNFSCDLLRRVLGTIFGLGFKEEILLTYPMKNTCWNQKPSGTHSILIFEHGWDKS